MSYLERSLELRPEQQRATDRANTLRTLANVLGDTGRGREAIARREEALRATQIPLEKARITLELIDDRIEVGDLGIAKSLTAPLLAARDFTDPTVRIGPRWPAPALRSPRAMPRAPRAMRAPPRTTTGRTNWCRRSSRHSWYRRVRRAPRARATRRSKSRTAPCSGPKKIRTFSSNPTLRASLWRPLRPAFGFTIGLLARANSCGGSAAADPLGALAIAEASRGRALEDFRLRSTAKSDIESERAAPRTLRATGRRSTAAGNVSPQTVAADDARLEALRSDAARLRREIDLSGGLPASSRPRAEDLRPALRARIDAIPKDTAVVEYWLGKDEAFAWLLTRGRVQLVDLGPANRIDAAARRLHDAMHSWLTGTADERIVRARELHELIIAPLPTDLVRARTVYFIPDGALHAVPFAALAHGDRAHPRFLVDSHDVAVAPAFLAIAPDSERRLVAQELGRARRRRSGLRARRCAVRARTRARPLRRRLRPLTLRGSHSWTRLPATAREAATISKLLDRDAVQVLSGFDASRDSLLGRDLARYDILHFATHAVADTEAPQLSALVLSTVDAQGLPRVGEVFAGDLADQRLDAASWC